MGIFPLSSFSDDKNGAQVTQSTPAELRMEQESAAHGPNPTAATAFSQLPRTRFSFGWAQSKLYLVIFPPAELPQEGSISLYHQNTYF